MSKRLFIICLLFLAIKAMAGQHTVEVRLIDGFNGSAVSGAHVFRDGTILSVSKADGSFALPAGALPATVKITHVAYCDTILSIHPQPGTFSIALSRKTQRLAIHRVTAGPVDLIPDKPWFVSSYLVSPQGLLLLAYPQKMLNRQSLFLMDAEGEVTASRPWKPRGALFRDAAGGIWLRGTEQTWSIDLDNEGIHVGAEVMPTSAFDEGIARIHEVIGNHFYFGHYRLDHQWLDYYCYDHGVGKTLLLTSVFDRLGLKLRETRDIFETNEFEKRFADMCFFAPVYAPIARSGDSILLFNHAEGRIEYYDTLNQHLLNISIHYQEDRGFQKSILHDRVSGSFYAVFERSGIYSVRNIDIADGSPGPEITIPSLPFIEEMSVYDHTLYFLYRERSVSEFKKIYRMTL